MITITRRSNHPLGLGLNEFGREGSRDSLSSRQRYLRRGFGRNIPF